MRAPASPLAGLALALTLAAGRAEADPAPLRFDARVDVPVTLGLLGAFGVTELLKARLAPAHPRWDGPISSLDAGARALRWKDPSAAATLSDFVIFAAAVSAVGLGSVAPAAQGAGGDVAPRVVIPLESAAVAMALTQATKFLVGRQRPCAHFAAPNTPRPCGADPADDNLSSFSGHTSFATALAVAGGTLASMRHDPLAPLVWTSGALFAASAGALRLAADKHYLTDVLVGAAVGAAVGFFVPWVFHAPASAPSAPSAAPHTGAPAAIVGFSSAW